LEGNGGGFGRLLGGSTHSFGGRRNGDILKKEQPEEEEWRRRKEKERKAKIELICFGSKKNVIRSTTPQ
jgi:hypothetical protein